MRYLMSSVNLIYICIDILYIYKYSTNINVVSFHFLHVSYSEKSQINCHINRIIENDL